MDDTRSRVRRQLGRSRSGLEEINSLISQGQQAEHSKFLAIGSFLVPSVFQIKLRDKSDASAKKIFRVNVPVKLLVTLGLVFVLIPVLIFLHKELHIHEDHHQPHFRQQKFVNVDQKQAMAHFTVNQNQALELTSQDESRYVAKTDVVERTAANNITETETTEVRNPISVEKNSTIQEIEGGGLNP